MNPHYVEATLAQDGCLILHDLPFAAGDSVEVIILARQPAPNGKKTYPLRGEPIEYIDPLEPVAHDDWESLR